MSENNQSKFEEDLKVFMPVIWELYQLEKAESHLSEVAESLLAMRAKDHSGFIKISYVNGHITEVFSGTVLTTPSPRRGGS